MKYEAWLTSVLFITGRISGPEILNYLLSTVSDSTEAQIHIYGVCRALARMYDEGSIGVKESTQGRFWHLTSEASQNWSNEVLREKESGVH